MDFGNPATRKKIYKVYLSYKGDARNVLIKYGVNGLLPASNFFTIASDGSSTKSGATGACLNFTGANGSTPGTNDWLTAELIPGSAINNIYSFQLHCDCTVGATFEINDITFIYRLKNVK